MEEQSCTHNCESCSENCASRQSPQDFREAPHAMSKIKKVIGVASGKGGVGKSIVTSMLAVALNRRGYKTAILDADITGPSIPKAFGIHGKAQMNDFGLLPRSSKTGIDIMSINLLLDNENDPVIWRGPVLANVVKQFWTDVIWEDVDFLFVDMPPGTGDVPLTVFQSLPVDGLVMVTSPQELVSMIVSKALGMAEMMNIPLLGIVENMSYLKCPDCGKVIKPFGESGIDAAAKEHGTQVLAKMPMDPAFAKNCDQGLIELYEGDFLETAADKIESLLK